jgi:hypothetical protein
VLIENVVNIFFVTSLSVSLHNRLGKYIFIKKICTPTYYTQQGRKAVILENIHLIVSIPYFTHLRHIARCFFTLDMIFLNGKAYATPFTTVFRLYCSSISLLLISIITVVLQLYYCSPAILLFYIFTLDLHYYCCSPALLLFSSSTAFLQLYWFSPALRLFSCFTVLLQLYCCSTALLLFPSFTVFSIFTVVFQLYYCFPALLLFYSFTTVL